jgi:hypothetical protein
MMDKMATVINLLENLLSDVNLSISVESQHPSKDDYFAMDILQARKATIGRVLDFCVALDEEKLDYAKE